MQEKLISAVVVIFFGLSVAGLLGLAEPKRTLADQDVTTLATESAAYVTQFGTDCTKLDLFVRDAEPIAGSPVAMSSCHIG